MIKLLNACQLLAGCHSVRSVDLHLTLALMGSPYSYASILDIVYVLGLDATCLRELVPVWEGRVPPSI